MPPNDPPKQAKFLTGVAAIRLGFIDGNQLLEALAIQKRSVPRPHLGAVLVELGHLTARDLTDEVLYAVNAVRDGNVTLAQVDEAIEIRNRSKPKPTLSSVLFDLGYLTPKPVVNPNRFGAIAVQLGLVTPAQVDEAVGVQSRSQPRPFLGAVLVELGYLTPRTLMKVLDAQAAGGGWRG